MEIDLPSKETSGNIYKNDTEVNNYFCNQCMLQDFLCIADLRHIMLRFTRFTQDVILLIAPLVPTPFLRRVSKRVTLGSTKKGSSVPVYYVEINFSLKVDFGRHIKDTQPQPQQLKNYICNHRDKTFLIC